MASRDGAVSHRRSVFTCNRLNDYNLDYVIDPWEEITLCYSRSRPGIEICIT